MVMPQHNVRFSQKGTFRHSFDHLIGTTVEGTLSPKIRVDPSLMTSREEAIMVDVSKLKIDKIEHPATFYATPDDIVKDNGLSAEEKKKALNSWEQDARQQLTASSEGMAGCVYRKPHPVMISDLTWELPCSFARIPSSAEIIPCSFE
jgi:hypothetical protein